MVADRLLAHRETEIPEAWTEEIKVLPELQTMAKAAALVAFEASLLSRTTRVPLLSETANGPSRDILERAAALKADTDSGIVKISRQGRLIRAGAGIVSLLNAASSLVKGRHPGLDELPDDYYDRFNLDSANRKEGVAEDVSAVVVGRRKWPNAVDLAVLPTGDKRWSEALSVSVIRPLSLIASGDAIDLEAYDVDGGLVREYNNTIWRAEKFAKIFAHIASIEV